MRIALSPPLIAGTAFLVAACGDPPRTDVDPPAPYNVVMMLIAAVFSPWIAPYDPNAMDFMMLDGLSWSHPLGLDDLRRDLLSRIIHVVENLN